MSEEQDEIDWSLTTWEGGRRAQLRHALTLTLRERMEAMEGLNDVARRFRALHAQGAFKPASEAGSTRRPHAVLQAEEPNPVYESRARRPAVLGSEEPDPLHNYTKALALLQTLTRRMPFPWQRRLLRRFLIGSPPTAIDVPTGLGKTMTIAIWLVARAVGAAVSRRLVYVVDRRAVVDQATAEAEALAQFLGTGCESADESIRDMRWGLGLSEGQRLPVSALRGQFVDNRRWLEDPTMPAIVVGTVDMIGSRILFEGYGVSRGMRPVHAGLLGADAMVVLDEAHLVPPFEALLAELASPDGCRRGDELLVDVPKLHLLPLSATGRHHGNDVVTLDADDENDARVRARLYDAAKPLRIEEHGVDADLAVLLADRAWNLRTQDGLAARVVVFCDQRKVAQEAAQELVNRAKAAKLTSPPVRLLVGARRVKERQILADDLIYRRFLEDSTAQADVPAFLVATSAGEVGVDLDADAMVCDLVAWERMVQRFGRVNRRPLMAGPRTTPIVVLARIPPESNGLLAQLEKETNADKRAEKQIQLNALTEVYRHRLEILRRLATVSGEVHDASTGELRRLKDRAFNDRDLKSLVTRASTPEPVRPALNRALIDAWSMTSLEHHPGRPQIQPWLRGWIEEEEPQTELAWRRHLPWRRGAAVPDRREVDAFFDTAPLQLSEILATESWLAIKVLRKRAKVVLADSTRGANAADPAVIVLDQGGGYVEAWSLAHLTTEDKKSLARMESNVVGRRLVIRADLGGLDQDGLLDASHDDAPATLDDEADSVEGGWTEAELRGAGFRVVVSRPTKPLESGWRRIYFWPYSTGDDSDAQGLRIDAWRETDAAGEAPEIARVKQSLAEHHAWTGEAAGEIGRRLSLPQPYVDMLVAAAREHDAGKDRAIWQDSVGAAPAEWPLAKSDARGDPSRLKVNGIVYRHEFGSLFDAKEDRDISALSDDLRDLALHLIAAHHGFARPLIAALDPKHAPSASEEVAREVALRFARLQKRWGPWGLAWWEAVFRAADWAASRRLNQ